MASRRVETPDVLDIERPEARIPTPPPAVLDAPPSGSKVFQHVPRILDAPPPGSRFFQTAPVPAPMESAPDPHLRPTLGRTSQFEAATSRSPLMQRAGRTERRALAPKPVPEFNTEQFKSDPDVQAAAQAATDFKSRPADRDAFRRTIQRGAAAFFRVTGQPFAQFANFLTREMGVPSEILATLAADPAIAPAEGTGEALASAGLETAATIGGFFTPGGALKKGAELGARGVKAVAPALGRAGQAAGGLLGAATATGVPRALDTGETAGETAAEVLGAPIELARQIKDLPGAVNRLIRDWPNLPAEQKREALSAHLETGAIGLLIGVSAGRAPKYRGTVKLGKPGLADAKGRTIEPESLGDAELIREWVRGDDVAKQAMMPEIRARRRRSPEFKEAFLDTATRAVDVRFEQEGPKPAEGAKPSGPDMLAPGAAVVRPEPIPLKTMTRAPPSTAKLVIGEKRKPKVSEVITQQEVAATTPLEPKSPAETQPLPPQVIDQLPPGSVPAEGGPRAEPIEGRLVQPGRESAPGVRVAEQGEAQEAGDLAPPEEEARQAGPPAEEIRPAPIATPAEKLALSDLELDQRDNVIEEQYEAGKSPAAIAKELGTDVDTVSSVIQRFLQDDVADRDVDSDVPSKLKEKPRAPSEGEVQEAGRPVAQLRESVEAPPEGKAPPGTALRGREGEGRAEAEEVIEGPDVAPEGQAYLVRWANGRGIVAFRNKADAARVASEKAAVDDLNSVRLAPVPKGVRVRKEPPDAPVKPKAEGPAAKAPDEGDVRKAALKAKPSAGGKFDPNQFKSEQKRSSIGMLPILFQERQATARHRRGGFATFGPVPPVRTGEPPPGAIETREPRITIFGKEKDITAAQRYFWGTQNAAYSSKDPLVIKAVETMIDLDVHRMQDSEAHVRRDRQVFKSTPKKHREQLFDLMDEYIHPDEIDGRTDIPDALKPALKHFKTEAETQRLEIIGIKRKMARQMFMNMTRAQLGDAMKKAGVTPPEKWIKTTAAKLLSEAAIPDTWGRQYSYIPHMFFGQYRLTWTDSKGESHGGIGAAETQAEAFDKLWHFRANNPDLDIARLDAKPDIVIPPDMLRVSTGRLFVLKKQLKDAADLANEEVQQALRGVVGQKRSRKKFWGPLKRRKGALGFDEDFFRIWTMNIHGFNRWKYLTEMNRRVVPITESLRANGKPNWADHIEGTLDYVWGRKPGVVIDNFDSLVQSIPVIGQYIRPQAMTRWLSMIRTVNYIRHLQTGRFFVVNNLQPLQTLWPVIGEKGMYRAYKLAFSKEGADILKRHNVTGLGKFLEDERMLQLGRFTPAGASEMSNQRIAFLGLYDFARNRMGMDDAAAARYARLRGQVMTQFLFTRANQPPMLRHPITQTTFQYKTFPIKNLGLAWNLYQSGKYGGVARWFLAQFLIGGIHVVWPQTILGIFGRGYLGHALWQWLKDEYGETVADGMIFGAPSLVGIDLSGSVNVIETPYGRTTAEKTGNLLMGPTGQTISRVVSRVTDPKKVADEGIAESIAKGFVETSSTLKQFEAFVKWLGKDTAQLDARGRKRYELEGADLFFKIGGFRMIPESIARLQLDAIFAFKAEYDRVMDGAARKLAAYDYTGAYAELGKWNSLYPEAWVTIDDVKARAESRREAAEKGQLERTIELAPKKVRRVLRGRGITP